MATAGTLLSDLDSKSPVMNKDDDLVNKILADMNMPSPSNPIMNVPPPSGNGRMINSPNPNTTYPMASDPSTSTAHMIGKDFPTNADFANLMHAPNHSQGFMQQGQQGFMQQGQQGQQGFMQQGQQGQYPTLMSSTIYSDIFAQIKQPLIVSIIIFLIGLPVVNVLIGYYVPWLLRVGGDLTTVGLGVKAVFGGFLFWFIQKILVPLMNT